VGRDGRRDTERETRGIAMQGWQGVSVSVTKCDHAVYKSPHCMLLHRCTYMIVYGRVCESNNIEIL
jgi:hypothetical protein